MPNPYNNELADHVIDRQSILAATFLIVFDETHLTLEQARNARAFVIELLKTVRAGDRVTLVGAHDGRTWVGVGPEGAREVAGQLESLSGRLPRRSGDELMTPYEAMRVVHDHGVDGGDVEPRLDDGGRQQHVDVPRQKGFHDAV